MWRRVAKTSASQGPTLGIVPLKTICRQNFHTIIVMALLVFWCGSCTAALLRPAFSHSGDHPLVRPLEGSEFLSACATAPVAVVLFHGERCRKCVAFTPKFVRLAKEYQGQAQFFKLSVNRNAELCAAEHVLTLLPWCVLETQATAHPVRAPVSHSRASQRQHLRWGLLRTTSLGRRCVLDQKPTTKLDKSLDDPQALQGLVTQVHAASWRIHRCAPRPSLQPGDAANPYFSNAGGVQCACGRASRAGARCGATAGALLLPRAALTRRRALR